jgi:drug/metabolite transporter (DMT)-like permease
MADDDQRTSLRRAPMVGVALIACGAALWGLDGTLRTPLVDTWSPWTIVLYEHIILTACVAPYLARHLGGLRALDGRGWASALIIAWGASALATLAFTTAFQYGNPSVVVLLQKTQPVWAIAAAAIVVRELPRPQIVAFLLPAAVGTYLLSFGWTSPADAFDGAQGRAALLALTAAALWGSATAFGRRALRQIDFGLLTSIRFTMALPLLLVIALWKDALAPPAVHDSADWARLLVIAIGPGLVAMLLYYRGLSVTPAPVATLAELAFPATALIANYVYLGTTISGMQWAGFAILWISITLLHRVRVRVPATDVAIPQGQPVPGTA